MTNRISAFLIFLCWIILVPSAGATALDTQGCPESTPVWKIEYHAFFDNGRGVTLDRAQMPQILDEANQFVQLVGSSSSCSVRIHMEVIEEAGAGSGYRTEFIPGFDSAFTLYPEAEPTFSGKTNLLSSIMPSKPGVKLGYKELLFSQFMFQVESFYEPSQGWPAGGVNDPCSNPNYADCYTNIARWYGDVLAGRVIENGVPKGILPSEFISFGVPTAAFSADPSLAVSYDPQGKTFKAIADPHYSGNVVVSITTNGQTTTETLEMENGFAFKKLSLPTGTHQVCLSTERISPFRAATACQDVVVKPDTRDLLKASKKGKYLKLKADPRIKGQRAKVTLSTKVCKRGVCKTKKTYIKIKLKGTTKVRIKSKASARVVVKSFTKDGVRWPTLVIDRIKL